MYLTESKKIIYALIIGDGYVNRRGCLTIEHSNKQFDYLNWKYNLLKKFNFLSDEGVPKLVTRSLQKQIILVILTVLTLEIYF